MTSYPVPHQATEVCYEIKKSRFIARLCPATDREQALSALAQAKVDYPDARHHCWAYQLGSPQSPHAVAMSDDGEPSGTAGKPILNVIQHKGIGNVMLVVIRYFGGIKLGAGGLVRAYSKAAQLAFDNLSTVQHIEYDRVDVLCHFADEQPLRHWLEQHNAYIEAVQYQQQVQLTVAMDDALLASLDAYLASLKDAQRLAVSSEST